MLIALDTTERIAGQSAAFHTHGMNFGHGVGYGTQARHRSERLTSKVHVQSGDHNANTLIGQLLGYLHKTLIKELGFVYPHHIHLGG